MRSKADARAEKLTRGIFPASTQSGERAAGKRSIAGRHSVEKLVNGPGADACIKNICAGPQKWHCDSPREDEWLVVIVASIASRRGTELSSWLIVIAR